MAFAVTVAADDSTKPWMVMVHAMSQDHRVFSSQVAAFRARFRILLVDLPGHGLAADLEGPYGHVEGAGHVRRAIAAEGVEQAHYWGTHTGSALGLYLAATVPGIFSSLVLEGPVLPGTNPPIALEILEQVKAVARQDGLPAAIDLWWRTGPWFDHMRAHPEDGRAEQHLAIIRGFGGRPWTEADQAGQAIAEIEPALARIEIPALLYNGIADHADFLSVAGALTELLPAARRETVGHGGGFPGWENPDATNKLVADFLASV